MDFDRNSLSKLLKLSDDELILVIQEIAKEAGVEPQKVKVGKADIAKIRAVLSIASDDDIARLLGQFGGMNNGRKS